MQHVVSEFMRFSAPDPVAFAQSISETRIRLADAVQAGNALAVVDAHSSQCCNLGVVGHTRPGHGSPAGEARRHHWHPTLLGKTRSNSGAPQGQRLEHSSPVKLESFFALRLKRAGVKRYRVRVATQLSAFSNTLPNPACARMSMAMTNS